LKIADDFLQVLNEYWIYETEVKEEFKSIEPCWTTIEVYLEKIEETEIIHAIGVNYRLKVDNFELIGSGADFNIWVAEGRIIRVELHKPSIDIIGHQNVTKTAEEAIENFISGKSDVRKLGFQEISGQTPREGVCSIDSVKLVYYVDFTKELQDNLPLVYMVSGKLTYVDPITGETVDSDFTDYQISTN